MPVLLCAAAFGLTAGAVFGLGYGRWQAHRPQQTYAATAYVVDGGSNVRTPFRCEATDAGSAATEANARAEREAVERRAAWRRAMEEPCRKARDSVASAEESCRECAARLETFDRQRRETPKPNEAKNPRPPQEKENPRRLELREQLAKLERRRDELLVDRTPLHPAVREIEGRIADVQAELASTPTAHDEAFSGRRNIGPELEIADVPTTACQDDMPPAASVPQNAAESDKIAVHAKRAELVAAVERARTARDAARRALEDIEQKLRAGPPLVVQYAEAVPNPLPPDAGLPRLVWTALMAGAIMTFGIGAFSAGVRIEPPVATVAEVEAASGAPILGYVPCGDGPVDAAAIRRQTLSRRTMMSLGLLLAFVSPLLALWGIGGI